MDSKLLPHKLRDPFFYPVDFDFQRELIVFARARPAHFSKSLMVSADDFPVASLTGLSFDDVTSVPAWNFTTPALKYLFHLPFTGSSLLSKYLEHSMLVLRDPVALFALYVPPPGGKRFPPSIARLRRATLRLLSRPLDPRGVLIRTAGSYPQMIGPLVRAPEFHSAVFLYSAPESYLAQVLKSPLRRRNARILLAQKKRGYVQRRCGERLELLTDASVAALTWLFTTETVLNTARTTKKRIRTLDSANFFLFRQGSMDRMCAALDVRSVPLTREQFRRVDSTHAKTGEAFGRSRHKREIEAALEANRQEIASALEFLERIDPKSRTLHALKALSV